MKLPTAKSFFPEFMSKCCGATVHNGYCCHCGHRTPLPFYFSSREPMADQFLIEQEAIVRASLPVGAELCMLVRRKA